LLAAAAPKRETPLPTGSGVLGSGPDPAAAPEGKAGAGVDPDSTERRRIEREINEKS